MNIGQNPEKIPYGIFDDGPISLWYEDFSEVKACIDQLLASGVDDLRAYFNSHPETVYECARKAKVVNANKATLSLYKARSKKELLAGIDKTFTEKSFDVFTDELLALAEGKRSVVSEMVTKTLSGELIDVIIHVSISPGHEDTWSQVLVAITDISERKRTEIALGRANHALATLSKCNGVLIHAKDEGQFLSDICRAIVATGGYNLAWIGRAEHDQGKTVTPVAVAGFDEGHLEMLNITWADGCGPVGTTIRTRELSAIQNIQRDPLCASCNEVALKYDCQSSIALPLLIGQNVYGALNIYAPEPDAFDGNEIRLLQELADDVAYGIERLRARIKRLQAEEALQKSERQYHEIIKTARDAFVSMDADGIITDWNPQAEEMFGWSREKVLGRLISQTIMPPESGKAHTKGLKHYLATGEGPVLNQHIEVNARHRDGHTFPVELSIVPVHIDDTVSFNAFIRNLSNQAEAKRALKQSLVGTIVAVSKAIEARDAYTAGHQQRVAQLARCIAQEMGLDTDRVDGLRMGATIHDIGKIYLPAEILSKPTKLTDTEFALIKSHCQVGYDILKDIEFPWPIADIAHQHHERLDGTGYPQGLKGDEICLEARIVAVADVVEAISSHRPYRAALGIDVALQEIEKHRGEWYDSAAVDACVKLFREKDFSFDT